MFNQKKCSRFNYLTLRLSQFDIFHIRSNKKAKSLNGKHGKHGQHSTLSGETYTDLNTHNGFCHENDGLSDYQKHGKLCLNDENKLKYNKNEKLHGKKIIYSSSQHYEQLKLGEKHEHHQHHFHNQYQEHYETHAYGYNNNIQTPGSRPGGPNLVNKQLVLPFVPPSFPNTIQDGVTHLIKPSEYLKSISDKRSCPSSSSKYCRSTDTEDYMQIQVANQQPTGFEPPKPPPPPPPPFHMGSLLPHGSHAHKNDKEAHGHAKFHNQSMTQPGGIDSATRKTHQPLSAISIQDLNSVQLRRTADTQKVPKPFQMPARSLSMQCLSTTSNTISADIINELKISKDLPGIRKMKIDEQMTNRSDYYMEVSKQFVANNYIEQLYLQIPEKDQAGNVIPDWKRQMLAKKAAERAKKEFEERLANEAENRRLSQIPQWKRDLLARREETEHKLKSSVYTPKVEENNRIAEGWTLKNRAVSIDNIAMTSCTTATTNAENSKNNQENMNEETVEKEKQNNNYDEDNNIIPWRAQLRKTNSRLSLL